MRRCLAIIIALASSCVVGGQIAGTKPADPQRGSSLYVHDDLDLAERLLDALRPQKLSGQLEYRGTCEAVNSDIISLPPISVAPPQYGKNGLLTVREMLGDNKDVSVTEQPPGIVRIRLPGVSGEILHTRISRLSLNRDEQYDPNQAVSAVLNAEEVESAMRRLNTNQALAVIVRQVRVPSKGAPHLGPFLKNVTVGEALAEILRTFRGVVVYDECTRPNGEGLFDINFYGS
jgi:hypothetical protein